MKVLDFKTVSPFFEQCRDGEKPFDFRKWDAKDSRFRALSQVRFQTEIGWAIRFTNPRSGESFCRQLLAWDYIRDTQGLLLQPEWIILFLGDIVLA